MTSRREASAIVAIALAASAFLAASVVACGLDAVGTAVPESEGGGSVASTPPTGTTDPADDAGPDAELDASIDAADDASDATVNDGGDAGVIAFVQSMVTGYSNTTSRSATLTVTAGNALVVATYLTGTQAMSVSDTLGNVFAPATKTTGTTCSASVAQLWYVTGSKGGADTVTVSVASNTNIGITVAEYSGVATADALDVVSNAVAASSSNAMSAPSLTTTAPHAIIVSFFHDAAGTGTMTPGGDYTARVRDTGFYTLLQDDAPGRGPGVRAVTAALPAAKSDSCWGALAMALTAP